MTNAQIDDDSTAQMTNVDAINSDSRVSEYVTSAEDCINNQVPEQTADDGADINLPCGGDPEVTAATVTSPSCRPLTENHIPPESGESITSSSHGGVMTRSDEQTDTADMETVAASRTAVLSAITVY